MPVDMMSGFPVRAIFWINAMSTSSNDATLWAGTFICFEKVHGAFIECAGK